MREAGMTTTWIADWEYQGSQRGFLGRKGTKRTQAPTVDEAKKAIREAVSKELFETTLYASGVAVKNLRKLL